MTQRRMAELFGVAVPAISKHLKNIFERGELLEGSVVSKIETTAADGKVYLTAYYNLDAIIAVGYRVNSYQATQFRIWATQTLKEYITKGFVLDDERLKQGQPEMQNPTLVVVTDRNDLDGQLYETFCSAQMLLKQTPEQIEDLDDLRSKLAGHPAGGIFFTTIQKFKLKDGESQFPVLSKRHRPEVAFYRSRRMRNGCKMWRWRITQ